LIYIYEEYEEYEKCGELMNLLKITKGWDSTILKLPKNLHRD
jgi:hypothetical protein